MHRLSILLATLLLSLALLAGGAHAAPTAGGQPGGPTVTAHDFPGQPKKSKKCDRILRKINQLDRKIDRLEQKGKKRKARKKARKLNKKAQKYNQICRQ